MQYQWQSSTTGLAGSFTNLGAVTASSTYSPPTSPATTTYYQVILMPNVASCNNATSNVISVAVNPLPNVTCPLNSSTCLNTAPYALTGGLPASGTYSGNGVSGGNFNPASAGAGPQTITYTYTDGNGCSNSCSFTITVNPVPTVNAVSNQTVCNGSPTTAINFTGTVTGKRFYLRR